MTNYKTQTGTALLVVVTVVLILATISSVIIYLPTVQTKGLSYNQRYEKCYGVLQAGIAEAIIELNKRNDVDGANPNNLVSFDEDADFENDHPWPWQNAATWSFIKNDNSAGRYRVNKINPDSGDAAAAGKFTLEILAEFNGVRRRAVVKAEAEQQPETLTTSTTIIAHPFRHALSADRPRTDTAGNIIPYNWGGTLQTTTSTSTRTTTATQSRTFTSTGTLTNTKAAIGTATPTPPTGLAVGNTSTKTSTSSTYSATSGSSSTSTSVGGISSSTSIMQTVSTTSKDSNKTKYSATSTNATTTNTGTAKTWTFTATCKTTVTQTTTTTSRLMTSTTTVDDLRDKIRPYPPTDAYNTYDWEGVTKAGNVYMNGPLNIVDGGYIQPGGTVRSTGIINESSSSVVSTTNTDFNASTEVLLKPSASALPSPNIPDYQTMSTQAIHIRAAEFNLEINTNTPDNAQGNSQLGHVYGAYNSSTKQSTATSAMFQATATDPRHIFLYNPNPWNSSTIKNPDNTTKVQGIESNKVDYMQNQDGFFKTGTYKRDNFFLEDKFSGSTSSNYRPNTARLGPTSGTAGVDEEDYYDAPRGQLIKIDDNGNDKVYVVHGNLFLSNSPTYSYLINSLGDTGTHITIATYGNIYLCDNFLYSDLKKDGVSFIALKCDEDYPDEYGNPITNGQIRPSASGNIRFGDPGAGTTYRFAAFMFAENNFEAANVNSALFVYGNMTAGNAVNISKPTGQYLPLIIDYDARMELNTLHLPGIPTSRPEDPTIITSSADNAAYRRGTFRVVDMMESIANPTSSEW